MSRHFHKRDVVSALRCLFSKGFDGRPPCKVCDCGRSPITCQGSFFGVLFHPDPKSVLSKRCSAPKVFRAFLTHFWRNFVAFLTHFGRSSFPNKTRPILTHFWRIFDALLTHFWRILAIADAFSENTFWTISTKNPRTPPFLPASSWLKTFHHSVGKQWFCKSHV